MPKEEDPDVYIKKLISWTAQGDLFEEMQVFLNQHGCALTSAATVIQHALESFLSPDEQMALTDEVKKIKQSPREEVPAYNRCFRKAADVAYISRPDTQ